MANLRSVIENCILLSQSLCGKNLGKFLSVLSNTEETNLHVFGQFAGECPSVILAVLFRLGHFCNNRELLYIAGEVIESRLCFGENEEEDAGGHIEYLLLHHRRFLPRTRAVGKFFIFSITRAIIEKFNY